MSTSALSAHRVDTGTLPSAPAEHRMIAVGVRDARNDASALRWAVFDARPGTDLVYVLHAHEPHGTGAQREWEAVSAAIRLGSQQRASVAIVGSAAAGAAEQVLLAHTAGASELVVGDDELDVPRRRVALHLQRTAHCPVVCVPRGAEDMAGLPVTVVVDDLGLADETLEFAARYAERHLVTLDIVRGWFSLHLGGVPTPATLADEQAQLDGQLDDIRTRHPHISVVSRIELDESWLPRVRAHSGLVVLARQTAARLGQNSPIARPLCPIAFVPEGWLKLPDSDSQS